MYYSQFKEDVFIDKYIKENKLKVPKVIIEVGAGHPETFSNSRHFIKHKGYKAVLIEPNYLMYNQLKTAYAGYPNVDIYQLLITDKEGVSKLTDTKEHWAYGKEHKDGIKGEGQHVGTNRLVNVLTNSKVDSIGVMTLDIEGNEVNVLKTMNEDNIKPYILAVEALSDKAKKAIDKELKQDYKEVGQCELSYIYVRKDLIKSKKNK